MKIAASLLVAGLALATAAGATPGHSARAATPLAFGPQVDLGTGANGEPSIQDDGHGNVYISAPVGGPSALNGLQGVAFWHSADGGTTWGSLQNIGFQAGGFDSDVIADPAGKVYVADLAAATAAIIHSTDQGATWSNPPTQTGPEDDREWLTAVGSTVYLAYHDLAANVPLIWKSTDGGQTFTPVSTNLTSNTQFAQDAAGATLVSKMVVDGSGDLFLLTNTSTAAQNAHNPGGSGPLDRIYVSESKDGGSTWTTTLVTDVSNGSTDNTKSGSFGKVFNQMGIDAAGNIYIAVAGTLSQPAAGQSNANMFLIRGLRQSDGSYNWLAPLQLTTGFAQVFPAIAVGQAGQVAVGYYGTTAVTGCDSTCYTDFRNNNNKFQYYVTETTDALDATPVFSAPTQVTTQSPHPGGICVDGVLCGTPASAGGNRNLADFESMTVDPAGNLELTIPADFDGSNTHTVFYKQVNGTGAQLVPGAVNGNGTGSQTWVSTAQVPEAPWIPALLVAGGGGAVLLMRRRRSAAAP